MDDRHVAQFDVIIDGTSLTAGEGELLKLVKVVRVTQNHDGPDQFEMVVHVEQPHGESEPLPVPDAAYTLGGEVEVKMGLETTQGEEVTSETVFKGLTTAVSCKIAEGEATEYRLYGFCRLHLLTRVRKTLHWESIKYSEVADKIAKEVGLSVDADATTIQHEYVSLNNQSFFAFLSDLAHRVGYRLSCDDKKLIFKKPEKDGELEIEFGKTLKRAKFRVDTSGVVNEVQVLGFDQTKLEQVLGKGTDGDVTGSGTKGASLVKEKYTDSAWWITDFPVDNDAEANELAKAVINERALKFAEVEAEIEGDATLKPLTEVKFKKVPPPFEDGYLVLQAVHEWTQETGYRTKFLGARSWWKG